MNAIELSRLAPYPGLQTLAEQAAQFLEAARTSSTRRAYASDLSDFEAFCGAHRLACLPATPETVALYITHLTSRAAVSTIKRRLAAITYIHRQHGYQSPATTRTNFVVREVLAGITRTLGVAQQSAEPLLGDAIRLIVAACPQSLLGARDRALILLGFAAGSRRSELASILEIRDLSFTEQGLYMRMRQSKTDQKKVGRTIAIPFGQHSETCPVLAIRAWLRAAGITSGLLTVTGGSPRVPFRRARWPRSLSERPGEPDSIRCASPLMDSALAWSRRRRLTGRKNAILLGLPGIARSP